MKSGTNLWTNFQCSELSGNQTGRKEFVALDYHCDYCQPRREVSLGQEGSMWPFSCSSSIKSQTILKLISYTQSTYRVLRSPDKHVWFPRPSQAGKCDHTLILREGNGAQKGRVVEWKEAPGYASRFSQYFNTGIFHLGQSVFSTTLPPTTPPPILIIDLIQWVVDAGCLQIGCDFI